jgi:hypothetical protein
MGIKGIVELRHPLWCELPEWPTESQPPLVIQSLGAYSLQRIYKRLQEIGRDALFSSLLYLCT